MRNREVHRVVISPSLSDALKGVKPGLTCVKNTVADAARINALRRAIHDGTFKVDARAIAITLVGPDDNEDP